MTTFMITFTLEGQPAQTTVLDDVEPEFIYGLWLGDRGVKYHAIDEIDELDRYGNVVRKYDEGSLQDPNLTGSVLDAGDYEYAREENPDLTWREFILTLTNGNPVRKRYTAQMIEEYGDRESFIVVFDSLQFIRGVATISQWKGENWRDILYNIHEDLDTEVDITNM